MTEVSVVGPGGGEVIHLGPTQLRILEDGHSTGHRLGMAEIRLAPRTTGPPQHRHARHDEGFYVVSGIACFTVGTTTYEAPAGTLVMIPPGVPHTFANPGDEPAVLLNTFTPDLYVQYFTGSAGHDRRRPGTHPGVNHPGDGPVRHRSRHRLRLAAPPRPPRETP